MGACVLACSKDPRNLQEREQRYIQSSPDSPTQKEIQRELQNPPETVETSQPHISKRLAIPQDHVIETGAGGSGQAFAEASSTMKKSRFCPEQLKNSSTATTGISNLSPSLKSSVPLCKSEKRQSFREFSIQNAPNAKLPKKGSSRVPKQHLKENTNPAKARNIEKKHNLEECSITSSLKLGKAATESLKMSSRNQKKSNLYAELKQMSLGSSDKVKSSVAKNTAYLANHLLPSSEHKPFDETSESLIKSTLNFGKPTLLRMTVKLLDGSEYTGQWMNGMKNGQGKLVWKDGAYEGNWKDNEMSGAGKILFQNGETYEGYFENHKAEGDGTFCFSDGSMYRGKWHQNKQQGYGIQQWGKKQYYSGSWSEGAKNGFGELFYPDGSYYKGHFDHNEFHGEGQYLYSDKKLYKGGWKHNKKSGKGVLIMQNGQKYEGQFDNDKMHGKGRYQQIDGTMYEGTWVNGKKQGVVDEITRDGERRTGMWYFGKFVYNLDKEVEIERSQKKKLKGSRYSH